MTDNKYSIANAFLEAERRSFLALDCETVPEPSARYEKKMERLIRAQKHPLWKYVNTVGKRAAVILLCLSVLFGSAMAVEASREPIVSFLTQVFETFTKVIIGGDEPADNTPETIEIKYTLSVLPDGYTMATATDKIFYHQVRWQNEQGDELIFTQYTQRSFSAFIDTEKTDSETVLIGDSEALYHISKQTQTFIWNADGFVMVLTCPLSVPKDEMTALAKSTAPDCS
ncbi:MAG: DUF4367 domain-containing protein [Lachnospiraceae bacterium]|nr:DUF4367 domain-containing protein [Lachnospiraceae bacterium]